MFITNNASRSVTDYVEKGGDLGLGLMKTTFSWPFRLQYQGVAGMNFTDAETPYTRIVEHKWFEFGAGNLGKTVISREYSSEWKLGDEPYYPVNDEKNGALYAQYRALAAKEPNVIFGGRLGEYKYYDMDQVIAAALERSKMEC